MTITLADLQALEDSGVQFFVRNCLLLDAEMALMWMTDQNAALAMFYGVSKDVMCAWDAAGGTMKNSGGRVFARCTATTKKGRRCLHIALPTLVLEKPKEFEVYEKSGGYCFIHGGTA